MKNPKLHNKIITKKRPNDNGHTNPDGILKKHLLKGITDITTSSNIKNQSASQTGCSCQGGCAYCRESNISSTLMPSIQHLLRENSNPVEPFGPGLNESGNTPPASNPTSTDNPQDQGTSAIKDKIAALKKAKEEFEQSGDISALKDFFPYLKSIQNDSKKLEDYKQLVNDFLTKGKFLMTDESFTKDTNLQDLKNTKPMDKFIENIIVASIVDLYHGHRSDVDSVLDRPEGLTIITLNKNKDSKPNDTPPSDPTPSNSKPSDTPSTPPENNQNNMHNATAVGMYNGKENSIYLDGTSTLISILNLDALGSPTDTPPAEGQNPVHKIEQFAVPQHEFTHAFDAVKDETGYHDDAVLPGMTSEDAQIIVNAFENIKKDESKLHPYAKTNKEEFLATAVEAFIDDPTALSEGTKELKDLYELFKKYFDYDPIQLQQQLAA